MAATTRALSRAEFVWCELGRPRLPCWRRTEFDNVGDVVGWLARVERGGTVRCFIFFSSFLLTSISSRLVAAMGANWARPRRNSRTRPAEEESARLPNTRHPSPPQAESGRFLCRGSIRFGPANTSHDRQRAAATRPAVTHIGVRGEGSVDMYRIAAASGRAACKDGVYEYLGREVRWARW